VKFNGKYQNVKDSVCAFIRLLASTDAVDMSVVGTSAL
jgi:hypothetical protein